jgi:hypothetical protein
LWELISKGGQSAAPNWTTWNNADAVTTTDILASTAPDVGSQMLHVCTTGQGCGLVQQYQATGTGPAQVTSTVSVFVVRGKVGMGTGNGGNTSANDAVSTVTGTWEQLTAPNGISPANEFIVYAVSAGGACYYIDNASVARLDPCHDIREELANISPTDFTTARDYEHAVMELAHQLIACQRANHEWG